jgi:hypothetical protein
MSDITIPLWVLLAVAGLPTMILLMLSVRLMRIKRYRNKAAAQPKMESAPRQTAWEGFGRQMDHMILEQQIDSVFGALATILETERVKLKALICRNPGGISSTAYDEMLKSKREPLNDRYEDTQHEAVHPRPQEKPRTMAQMVAEGVAPEEIAERLGLSQAEAALAVKIHNGRRGQRLEAVA